MLVLSASPKNLAAKYLFNIRSVQNNTEFLDIGTFC